MTMMMLMKREVSKISGFNPRGIKHRATGHIGEGENLLGRGQDHKPTADNGRGGEPSPYEEGGSARPAPRDIHIPIDVYKT